VDGLLVFHAIISVHHTHEDRSDMTGAPPGFKRWAIVSFDVISVTLLARRAGIPTHHSDHPPVLFSIALPARPGSSAQPAGSYAFRLVQAGNGAFR
jgi:hypothetical protein